MKLQAVLFLLVLATPALVHCNLEGDILHKLKTSWLDPNNVLQSWDPTLVNPCSWFHVTCNNNNSVIRVDLGVAGLSGPLVPQLAKLENLQYLELYGNNITGSIPRAFGNLKRLVSMDLHHNLLSGSIPPTLGKIKTMKYLRLNSNYLTGHVPLEILHLVLTGNLIELNVSSNQLSGRVRTSKLKVVTITLDAKKASG